MPVLTENGPGWRELPAGREFTPDFHRVREQIFGRIEAYYDRDHLTRAGDWVFHLDPAAPEALVIAALTHDLERSVPGGPFLDKANTPWDDEAYNRAHCDRSAEIVPAWLREIGAPEEYVTGVVQPIREHEFGGSPLGDVMQAADSISFLEQNGDLVTAWYVRGDCTQAKSQEKLDWMRERIRLERARPLARPPYDAASEMLRAVAAGEREAPADPGGAPGA